MTAGQSDAERAWTEWHKSFILVAPWVSKEHHMAFLAGYAAANKHNPST